MRKESRRKGFLGWALMVAMTLAACSQAESASQSVEEAGETVREDVEAAVEAVKEDVEAVVEEAGL